jgi:hypothetical protein
MASSAAAGTRLTPRRGLFRLVSGTADVTTHLLSSFRGFEQGRQVDA